MYATVQELVDALTPEEKAGLCTGAAVPRLGLPALRVNGLHSQESAGGVCFPSMMSLICETFSCLYNQLLRQRLKAI